MNENAKLWVEALRSGEYSQAQNALKNAVSYCCLGVACELYKQQTGHGDWSESGRFCTKKGNSDTSLPDDVMEWLGLAERSGTFFTGVVVSLAEMNDRGDTFEDIAECIASEPADLFA